MVAAAPRGNSIDAQLAQLAMTFEAVKNNVARAEAHQSKSTDLLHDALAEVYDFGLTLFKLPSGRGSTSTQKFLEAAGVTFTARHRTNPFLGLVKLAFPARSDSSISQYSTVLRYANQRKQTAHGFRNDLGSQGIKNLLNEAMDALNSVGRANNEKAKAGRIKRAETFALSLPRSAAVALPDGKSAPEGFAVVLARISSDNQAEIVDVLLSERQAVDPYLLRYDQNASATSHLYDAPLYRFFRAVDLLWGAAGRKGSALLLINEMDAGRDVCRVQIVSSERSFPGGTVSIDGHQGRLPTGKPFLLTGADAAVFCSSFTQHRDWQLDDQGELTADGLDNAITLDALPVKHDLRVALPSSNGSSIRIGLEELDGFCDYVRARREEHGRQNKPRKQKKEFSALIRLEEHAGRLIARLPTSLATYDLGEAAPGTAVSEPTFLLSDLEALLAAANRHDLALVGDLLDGDVSDAGLDLRGELDGDAVALMIPARIDRAYQLITEALKI